MSGLVPSGCGRTSPRWSVAGAVAGFLMDFMAARGRLPADDELPEAAASIRETFGSLKRAFRLVEKATSAEQWDEIARGRALDLLIYLALARFEGRPAFSVLPPDLQADIKGFFSSYTQACREADKLLFSVGDPAVVEQACATSRSESSRRRPCTSTKAPCRTSRCKKILVLLVERQRTRDPRDGDLPPLAGREERPCRHGRRTGCPAPGVPGGFGSAKGYGLAYRVTRMEEHDRLWHRMEKIARRLGGRDPGPEIPPRGPKWMRTATYDRLLEAWHDAGERQDEIYDAKIAGCIARLERLGE